MAFKHSRIEVVVGWNGSDRRGNSTPVQPKAAAKKPSPVRGLEAGAVLVAAVIGCYVAIFSGSDAPSQEAKAPSRPTSIKTAKATLPSAKPNAAVKVKTVEGGTEDLYVERVMERQRVDMGKETIPMPEECERKLTERR